MLFVNNIQYSVFFFPSNLIFLPRNTFFGDYFNTVMDILDFQVSATFAASLIISPALGAYIGKIYDDSAVVALATFVAASDLLFILIAVPESLPERIRPASWGAPISWEQADPFAVS